jgi:hypothetical protein
LKKSAAGAIIFSDDAVELGAELVLEHGGLQADHGAAEHLRLQADLVRRQHDADRAERIGANHHEIGVDGLNRAHDRRVVRRARRIGLVVENLEAVCLGIRARAFAGVAGKFRVLGHERDGRGLRILRRGGLEKSLGERLLGRRAGRKHREVLRISELGVHVEREQADEGLALLHHDRHRRRDHVGRVAAEHEVGLVDIEQLGVDARHRRRIALVVVVHELDRTPEQPALGVGLFLPDLHAEERLLAVGGEGAGQRHPETDGDRLAGRRLGAGRSHRRRESGGREERGDNASAFQSCKHGVLQLVQVDQGFLTIPWLGASSE